MLVAIIIMAITALQVNLAKGEVSPEKQTVSLNGVDWLISVS